MRPHFSISIHDVAPDTWSRCRPLLRLAARVGAPCTLLVVPRYHFGTPVDADAAFAAALHERLAAGDEVALHGCTHVDESAAPAGLRDWTRRRVLTAGEGEFAALGPEAARTRLREGLARLHRIGIRPRAFVPPAWLLDERARSALQAEGFEYTSTRDWLIPLHGGAPRFAPSLVWSSRTCWRRALSVAWNRARLHRQRQRPLLRVALHPAESSHAGVLQRWGEILDRLAAGRHPVLESAWLAGRA